MLQSGRERLRKGRPVGHRPSVRRRVEEFASLLENGNGSHGVQRSVARNDGRQVLALEQPHVDVELAVDVAEVMDRNDVRLGQPGSDLRLSKETLPEGVIRRQVRRQHLQSDDPDGRQVLARKTCPIPPLPMRLSSR